MKYVSILDFLLYLKWENWTIEADHIDSIDWLLNYIFFSILA